MSRITGFAVTVQSITVTVTPMREEPMADVQKWIDALRTGKVVGRIVLKK